MCTHKVPSPDPSGIGVAFRPCGKCVDCLRQYQQDWTVRLSEEVKAWDSRSVIFFTLTYADSRLPYQVSFYHPITNGFLQVFSRGDRLSLLEKHFRNLGLDSFFFTRSLREDTPVFRNERRTLQDSYLDIPLDERPALFVPTGSYEDINTWIRYCRKYFSRHVELKEYKDRKVNPYMKSLSWRYFDGYESDFPNSAYTPSFKYWITQEYGPSTLRPHYHGVLFGVSEEMFRDVFAPWWREHFGDGSERSVKYSVYDPAKGGMMYIAKYCAKGSFDHPLVSKSIHYPSGKEFISRSFINCVNWFGVDASFCVPPFRLISKGIGIRYPFNAELQRYWGVRCDDSNCFSTFDLDDVCSFPFRAYMQCTPLKSQVLDSFNPIDSVDGVVNFITSDFKLLRFDQCGKVIGESKLFPAINQRDFLDFGSAMLNKKFVRCYVYKGKAKVYECLMPRYYRRYLLSPYSRLALQDSLRLRAESDFARKRETFRCVRQVDKKETLLGQISFSEDYQQRCRSQETLSRFGRFYSRTFAGDVVV